MSARVTVCSTVQCIVYCFTINKSNEWLPFLYDLENAVYCHRINSYGSLLGRLVFYISTKTQYVV